MNNKKLWLFKVIYIKWVRCCYWGFKSCFEKRKSVLQLNHSSVHWFGQQTKLDINIAWVQIIWTSDDSNQGDAILLLLLIAFNFTWFFFSHRSQSHRSQWEALIWGAQSLQAIDFTMPSDIYNELLQTHGRLIAIITWHHCLHNL